MSVRCHEVPIAYCLILSCDECERMYGEKESEWDEEDYSGENAHLGPRMRIEAEEGQRHSESG